jgi:hypothetical protein
MNSFQKLFMSKGRQEIIDMIEKDLDSEDQKTIVRRNNRNSIDKLLLYFERDERKFVISVNEYWIEIYTECNDRFGYGLLSHRVDAFRTPHGMFWKMLSKTTEMKNKEKEKINRIKREEQHHQKMIDILYGKKNLKTRIHS